jgi:hypothetical protein
VEDQKGVPPISRITWFWALIFTFFTSGLFALAIGLNLSWWVRSRRRSGVAFFAYLLVTLLWVPEAIFFSFFSKHGLGENLFTAGAFLWIIAAFVLRRELQLYYSTPEGSTLEISPLWTALFSVYYLNYCLWVVRDSA